jgi:hypothetical protein
MKKLSARKFHGVPLPTTDSATQSTECADQVSDQIKLRNARPPEALTLPLTSQAVGTTRWQLAYKITPISSVPERGHFAILYFAAR